MSWVLVGAAVGGWTVAVVVGVVLSLRASRRETRMALQVRAHVEPYLRRRATELQLDAQASDPGATPDTIVAGICALADQLTAREKADVLWSLPGADDRHQLPDRPGRGRNDPWAPGSTHHRPTHRCRAVPRG